MKRRGFLEMLLAGLALMPACRVRDGTHPSRPSPQPPAAPPDPPAVDASSKIFWVKEIPDQAFGGPLPNRHAGIDGMVELMARNDLSFYKRKDSSQQSEAYGLIAADDVVLVKVNAQWKYRGAYEQRPRPRSQSRVFLITPMGSGARWSSSKTARAAAAWPATRAQTTAATLGVHANANEGRATAFSTVCELPLRGPGGFPPSFSIRSARTFIVAPPTICPRTATGDCTTSFPTRASPSGGGRRVELREGVWNGSELRRQPQAYQRPRPQASRHRRLGDHGQL